MRQNNFKLSKPKKKRKCLIKLKLKKLLPQVPMMRMKVMVIEGKSATETAQGK
jgi:hypothetical protein